MAKALGGGGKFLLNAYDITGDHHESNVVLSAEEVLGTAFGDTGQRRYAGQKTLAVDLTSYWEAGTGEIENIMQPLVGVTGTVFTYSPGGGDAGDWTISSQIMGFQFSPGARVGDMLSMNMAFKSNDAAKIIKGDMLASGAKGSTANGTAYNLGAVTATQYLYGVLHCTATSGSGDRSLDVIIQSDSSESFDSPTTRITMTQITTSVTSQWATPVAGAITDTWWRASWTAAGTSKSITIYCMMAIV